MADRKLTCKLSPLILLLVLTAGKAQYSFQDELMAITGRAGLTWNIYNASFRHFQGAVDCGLFQKGSGLGYSIMAGAEKALNDKLQLGISAGLINRSGSLTLDTLFPSLDTTSNQVVNVNTQNTIDAKLAYFEIQPEVKFVLTPRFINGPLRAVGAFRIGFPVMKEFRQFEKITSPENAVFINNGLRSKERQISEGAISSLNSVAFGFSVGLENMLKISNSNFFTQQLLFDYNFNSLINDGDWNTYALRFELGLRFAFKSEPQKLPEAVAEIEQPKKPDTVAPKIAVEEVATPAPQPVLSLKLEGEKLELLTGNELLATAPIVNAVFFDVNSYQIPSYYELKTGLENYFTTKHVEVHKYILPRIAEIIKKNPDSRLILEGTTSGKDYEPEGEKLSKRRAEAVKKIFLDLGIPEKIITVVPRIFPRIVSNQDFAKGVEENQRVDIIVKNAPLQEYVNIQKYVEIRGSVDFRLAYKNIPTDSIVLFASSLSDGEKAIDKPGDINVPVKKRLKSDEGMFSFNGNAHTGDLSQAVDKSIDLKSLPKKQVELNLDNFEAVLRFDYDRSELSDDNKGLLRQLCDFLPAGCTITIYGSTDALGTEARNQQLEKERASVTEAFIKSVSGSKFRVEVGRGVNKYSEDSPEGRFLNRCFKIRVRK